MGSQRMPGKVLADIAYQPMIVHVMRRAAAAPGVDQAWLCLSGDPADKPLRDFGLNLEIMDGGKWHAVAYGVAINDVLGRMAKCVEHLPLDTVFVRITGDCPLIDPMLIASAVGHFDGIKMISTSVTDDTGFPDGLDVEVFAGWMLANAAAAATDPADREHVTPWIRRHFGVRRLTPSAGTDGRSPFADVWPAKWSVDTAEELAFVREVHEALGPGLWGYPAVLDYLKRQAVMGYVTEKLQPKEQRMSWPDGNS